eukprot:TRINITY_DN3015_c0_g2_i2.p1 TRINITY_DN3015_c0_g2~~TRINITY_DN3015_c0_g2_i2.p1  ORF type:complete len:759 (-),score=136.33 TRINITY_DN3015_c0_g2_i2:621-2897(-)
MDPTFTPASPTYTPASPTYSPTDSPLHTPTFGAEPEQPRTLLDVPWRAGAALQMELRTAKQRAAALKPASGIRAFFAVSEVFARVLHTHKEGAESAGTDPGSTRAPTFVTTREPTFVAAPAPLFAMQRKTYCKCTPGEECHRGCECQNGAGSCGLWCSCHCMCTFSQEPPNHRRCILTLWDLVKEIKALGSPEHVCGVFSWRQLHDLLSALCGEQVPIATSKQALSFRVFAACTSVDSANGLPAQCASFEYEPAQQVDCLLSLSAAVSFAKTSLLSLKRLLSDCSSPAEYHFSDVTDALVVALLEGNVPALKIMASTPDIKCCPRVLLRRVSGSPEALSLFVHVAEVQHFDLLTFSASRPDLLPLLMGACNKLPVLMAAASLSSEAVRSCILAGATPEDLAMAFTPLPAGAVPAEKDSPAVEQQLLEELCAELPRLLSEQDQPSRFNNRTIVETWRLFAAPLPRQIRLRLGLPLCTQPRDLLLLGLLSLTTDSAVNSFVHAFPSLTGTCLCDLPLSPTMFCLPPACSAVLVDLGCPLNEPTILEATDLAISFSQPGVPEDVLPLQFLLDRHKAPLHPQLLAKLIERGAKLKQSDRSTPNLLRHLCQHPRGLESPGVVEVLVRHGMDPYGSETHCSCTDLILRSLQMNSFGAHSNELVVKLSLFSLVAAGYETLAEPTLRVILMLLPDMPPYEFTLSSYEAAARRKTLALLLSTRPGSRSCLAVLPVLAFRLVHKFLCLHAAWRACHLVQVCTTNNSQQ